MGVVLEGCHGEVTHRERRTGHAVKFHFQAEFTFLLEQVWLDTEEGKA